MKTSRFFLLALVSFIPAFGQPVPPPTPHAPAIAPKPPQPAAQPADLVVTGDDGTASLNVSSFQAGEAKLSLKNASDHEITITHFGFNSTAVLVPIAPIVLAPGAEKAFPFYVDGRQIPTPASFSVNFRIQDAKGDSLRSTRLTFTSRDAIVWEPRYVIWRTGDAVAPKTVRLIQGPPGMKVTGARSTSPGFTVTVSGQDVVITPANMTRPHGGAILVTTEPASPRTIFIPVNVLPSSPRPLAMPPGFMKPVSPSPAGAAKPSAVPTPAAGTSSTTSPK